MLSRIEYRDASGVVIRRELIMLLGRTLEACKSECASLFRVTPPRLASPCASWSVELENGESFIVPEVGA